MNKKYLGLIIGGVLLIACSSTYVLLNKKDTNTNVKGQNLIEKNVTKESVTKESATKESATNESVTKESVTKESVAEKSKPEYIYQPPGKYYIDEDIQSYAKPANMDMYKKVYDAVDNVQSEVDLSQFNPTDDEIEKLQLAIINRKFYELFYYKDSKYENKKLKITYIDTKENIEEQKKAVNEKIDYIINTVVKPEYSDLQKEFAIYRYITENTDYDIEGMKAGAGADMYTTLIKGKAICYSYAGTIKYLLNKVGIEAHMACNVGHTWNIVKIDGVYYNLDATGVKADTLYKFNFTDKEMTEYFKTPKSEVYFGNQNFEKLKTPDCKNDSFNFLRECGPYTWDGKVIYYANLNDEFKLYKIDLDGSNKQQISDVGMLNMVMVGDYFYYSDFDDKHLYKMKKDGTDKKLLDDSIEVNDLTVKDNKLFYGIKQLNVEKQLSLDTGK